VGNAAPGAANAGKSEARTDCPIFGQSCQAIENTQLIHELTVKFANPAAIAL
jgi:hypothetical protein